MNTGEGQIRGAIFKFFCSEKLPFFASSGCRPQFLE